MTRYECQQPCDLPSRAPLRVDELRHDLKLPSLAYGKARKREDHTIEAMGRRMRDFLGIHADYRPVTQDMPFLHHSAVVETNGLCLFATASTALRANVGHAEKPVLVLPLHGGNHVFIDGKRFDWNAKQSAMLLPAMPYHYEHSARSALIIKFDPGRLLATARTMLGPDTIHPDMLPNLATPKAFDLREANFSFDSVLGQVCRMIDQVAERREMLDLFGVDELVYRGMALLMTQTGSRKAHGRNAEKTNASACPASVLDYVCDYVLAHLDNSLTLTDLEAAGGVSARALQYAFRKRFDRSPMQWVRQQRLHAVHVKLLSAAPWENVTSIASRYFSNLGDFSRLYRDTFGELPSETLAKGRG